MKLTKDTPVCPLGQCDRPKGHSGRCSSFDGPLADDSLSKVAYEAGCIFCHARKDLVVKINETVIAICKKCQQSLS